MHPGDLDKRRTQPDAQVWGNSAERIRKIIVRIERKSAHKETVDRSLTTFSRL